MCSGRIFETITEKYTQDFFQERPCLKRKRNLVRILMGGLVSPPLLFPCDIRHHLENVLPQSPSHITQRMVSEMLKDPWSTDQSSWEPHSACTVRWLESKASQKYLCKPHLHWHHFYKILSHYGKSAVDSSLLYPQTFFLKIRITVELQAVTWLSLCLQEDWSKNLSASLRGEPEEKCLSMDWRILLPFLLASNELWCL